MADFDPFAGVADVPETPPEQVPGINTQVDMSPPPPADDGRPAHVPQKFWSIGDDGKGTVNHEAWGKAWGDAEKHLRQLESRIRNGSASLGKAPANADEYLDGFDPATLLTAAPRVNADLEKNPEFKAFFAAAHQAGMGVQEARNMLTQYYTHLNPSLPAPVDDAKRYSQAVASLGPAGPTVVTQIRGWLSAQHDQSPFSDAEKEQFTEMVRSPGGLAVLHRMMRSAQGTGAPASILPGQSANQQPDSWTDEQIESAVVSDRYKQDTAYQDRVNAAIERRYKDVGVGGSYSTTLAI